MLPRNYYHCVTEMKFLTIPAMLFNHQSSIIILIHYFMIWFILLLYLTIAALGAACCWMAFQIVYRTNYKYVREGKNKPLEQPELVAKGFAAMLGFAGAAAIVLLIAIPACGLPWNTWHLYLILITTLCGVWRSILLVRHRKLMKASGRGQPGIQ